MPHDQGSNQELMRSMMNDWRSIFGRMSQEIGRFLIKWGLMSYTAEEKGARINPKEFGRYLSAAAVAGLKAVLTERLKMEQERISGN